MEANWVTIEDIYDFSLIYKLIYKVLFFNNIVSKNAAFLTDN